tara:strand:- start:4172 stop:4423 length:252 start_codon:yes stop_codon:yes gene_type:complete
MPSVTEIDYVRQDDPVVVERARFTTVKYNALSIPVAGIVDGGCGETYSLVGVCVCTGIVQVVMVFNAKYEGIHTAMGFIFAAR